MSLRVEGIPGVLRFDPCNSLSLHVHWAGADPGPVLPSQVTQELRVPISGDISPIKPGCLTGWGKGGEVRFPQCTVHCCFIYQ